MQAEQSALRKKVDEVRGLLDLVNSDYHKIKSRIHEVESTRRDLKKEHETFIEQAKLKIGARHQARNMPR